MKIYVISDWPYHDNCSIFGAYSSEALARNGLIESKTVAHGPASRIIAVELDAPPKIDEEIIEEGSD